MTKSSKEPIYLFINRKVVSKYKRSTRKRSVCNDIKMLSENN